MTASKSSDLLPHQAEALFDLLVHRQLYLREVVRFNRPNGIDGYGPPFDLDQTKPSTSPILQSLLYRFVRPLPGLNSVSPTFWSNVRQLLKNFSNANLSQSYEHTGIGLRRTLASGCSALLEYPARGMYGGLRREKIRRDRDDYDPADPDDIKQAFWVLIQEVVYGEEIDALFDKIAETPNLEDHDLMIQSAHEYIIMNVASVLHNTFVDGPDSGYLQSLISNILKLIPWTLLRQSLRIGNAASMINAVTRLFLTKLSLTSFTNWVGLSNNPDDGMNLLQQIASTVFSWDIQEYQKRLDKIADADDAPSMEHLERLSAYVEADSDEQDKMMNRSMKESKSIITIICEEASLPKLTGSTHDQALQYLGLSASLRDREELSRIICKSHPDLLTQTVREGVSAYDPIIRKLHQSVDLSTTCLDLENFLKDFFSLFNKETELAEGEQIANLDETIIDTTSGGNDNGNGNGNGKKHKAKPKPNVSVEDIANVLRKHQNSLHKYLHQIAKDGGDITVQYREYVKTAAGHFRIQTSTSQSSSGIPSAQLVAQLTTVIASLPTDKRNKVLEIADSYAAYLSALSSVSSDRLRAAIDGENPPVGPGAYLARWINLMETEASTPLVPEGKPRYGKARVLAAGEEPVDVEERVEAHWRWPDVPDGVEFVGEVLGEKFGNVLGVLGQSWWNEDGEDGGDDVD